MAGKFKILPVMFDHWLAESVAHMDVDVRRKHGNFTPDLVHLPHQLTKTLKAELVEFHERFVITFVDKSANDYAFLCPVFYNNIIIAELNTPSYSPGRVSVDDLKTSHFAILQRLGLTGDKDKSKIGILYANLKVHKINYGFLKTPCACSNKNIQMPPPLPGHSLGRRIYRVEQLSPSTTKHVPHRPKAVLIKSFEKLNRKLIPSPKDKLHITTHDFSTLYTKLEHDVIREQFTQLLDALFDYIARKNNMPFANLRLLFDKNKYLCEWIDTANTPRSKDKPKQVALTAKDILRWTMLLTRTRPCLTMVNCSDRS
jgi:hypothetical protein